MTCSKRAFTSIEMLLATVLAATLMVGVLRVVGSIRPHLADGLQAGPGVWSSSMIRLLRWDLANARSVTQGDNKLVFVGYNALDRNGFGWQQGTGQSSVHQPVQVEYRLWSNGSQNWLLRSQTHTAEHTNRNTWSEVVARGVERFELKPPDDTLDLEGVVLDVWLSKPSPVPDRLRLVVQTNGNQNQDIDTMVVVR